MKYIVVSLVSFVLGSMLNSENGTYKEECPGEEITNLYKEHSPFRAQKDLKDLSELGRE